MEGQAVKNDVEMLSEIVEELQTPLKQPRRGQDWSDFCKERGERKEALLVAQAHLDAANTSAEQAAKEAAARQATRDARKRNDIRYKLSHHRTRNPKLVASISDAVGKDLHREVRDARVLIELPFCSPTKTPMHDTFRWRGDDGRFLEIKPLKDFGRPTQYDKRIVAYAISLVAQQMRLGNDASDWVDIVPAHYFSFLDRLECRQRRGVGRKRANAAAYQRLSEGVQRLVGSPVKTNVGSNMTRQGKRRARRDWSFGGIFKDAVFHDGSDTSGNDKRAKVISIQFSKWAWQLVKDNQLMLLDCRHLRLPPFEARVYEIAWYHLSLQKAEGETEPKPFPIGRAKLRAKIGREAISADPAVEKANDRRFGDDLRRLEKAHPKGLLGIKVWHDAKSVYFDYAEAPATESRAEEKQAATADRPAKK